MYAVIKTGGKQHKVRVGDVLDIEKLDQGIGEEVKFDHVLMANDGKTPKIGNPLIKDANVLAEITNQKRDKKVNIIKFKRRKHHIKRQGHRQYLTEVKIKAINA